jgi:hypothetical protein
MTTPPMPTPLVIVHCERCGKVLGSLDTMPDDWSGNLRVQRCKKCAVPKPRRLVGVLAQQKAEGFAMTLNIPLADLRSHAMNAKARKRPVSVNVRPFLKAR